MQLAKRLMTGGILLVVLVLGMTGLDDTGPAAADIAIVGNWKVRVSPGQYTVGETRVRVAEEALLKVDPPKVVTVTDERYDSMPLFNPDSWGWGKGVRLKGLIAEETSAAGLLVPRSVVIKSGPGDSPRYEKGKDYALEDVWATVGALSGGSLEVGSPFWASYRYATSRIDSIAVDETGIASLIKGSPDPVRPLPPTLEQGRVAIANLWIQGNLERLETGSIYMITEPRFRSALKQPPAAKLLPKSWKKLTSGGKLRILAWGDSVTAGGAASKPENYYQEVFVRQLRKAFPKANVELITVAWGGRNTAAFLAEPAGSQYNFEEKVLGAKPDLITMEFVNDAGLTPAQVEDRYSYLLKRFNEIGAEWVIITPHFVRPDWMNSITDRIEKDPRPYVQALRQFSKKHNVALADASLRWEHLAREGIPYTTLLSNAINHPDDRGHQMFAESLMDLFKPVR